MTHYKILESSTNSFKKVTFDEACKAKGITGKFNSATKERASRARLTSTHVFKGESPLSFDKLEDLAARDDITGYVKAWRAINHLTP